MSRLLLAVTLLLVAIFLQFFDLDSDGTALQDTVRSQYQSVQLVRVLDGDTIEVTLNATLERIRLLGVDASEIDYDQIDESDCFSVEARDYLNELLHGKSISIESDPLNKDRDAYDRLLRYVYANDLQVNLKLIKTGYTRYINYFPITMDQEFQTAEKAAKDNKLGLWKICAN